MNVVKKRPEISVIMLTYNRRQWVDRAIDSILAQAFTDWELIVVDNGSTDSTPEILRKYEIQDQRISTVTIPKSSIGIGRNAGLRLAKGKYIAYVDDDDVCDVQYLSFLYQLLKEKNADISICGTNLKNYNIEKVMDSEEALITLLRRKYFNVGFPTKLISRELLEKREFSAENRFDDIDLMPKVIASANKVVYHGLPLYEVNRHDSNHSSWTMNYSQLTPGILKEYVREYSNRTGWLVERFPNNKNAWQYFELSFYISMVDKISRFHLEACNEIKENLIRILSANAEVFLENENLMEFEREWMEEYICNKKN